MSMLEVGSFSLLVLETINFCLFELLFYYY